LTAIDNSLAAGPVVSVAQWLAERMGADVDLVHVSEDGVGAAEEVAAHAGLALRELAGPAMARLGDEMRPEDVVLTVVGCRGMAAGARPVGHVARVLLLGATKPVVVVPPDCEHESTAPDRLLVPLDDVGSTAAALQPTIQLLADAGFEVVALHVFDKRSVPPFWDQPQHVGEGWRREFVTRNVPAADVVHLRSGLPGKLVVDEAAKEHVGLIALAWSQDMSPGRAQTVQDVLCNAQVPVLLVPIDGDVQRRRL
jgi:hypothetical protein